jgi:hypothetical protein
MIERMAQNPWAVGIACAVGAVGLGIFYMTAAGAPVQYSLMIGAALAVGLVLLAMVGRAAER